MFWHFSFLLSINDSLFRKKKKKHKHVDVSFFLHFAKQKSNMFIFPLFFSVFFFSFSLQSLLTSCCVFLSLIVAHTREIWWCKTHWLQRLSNWIANENDEIQNGKKLVSRYWNNSVYVFDRANCSPFGRSSRRSWTS